MKLYTKIIILIAAIFLLIAGFVFLRQSSQNTEISHTSEQAVGTISTTIFPLFDIAREVGGNAVNVNLILPPGASPHTFEPSPSDIKAVESSTLVFAIGLEFDNWVDNILTDTNKITVETNINLRESAHYDEEAHEDHDESEEDHHADEEDHHEEEHIDEDGHSHGEFDPHYWLTISNAKIIAENIAFELSQEFPEKSDVFATNLENYLVELNETDDQIMTLLENKQETPVITLHDAWYYFMETYGLNLVGTFEPSAGREPTPQYLKALSEIIEENDIQYIYSEPQLSTESIDAFAEGYNVEIKTIDPIGGSNNKTDSYIKLMIHNATIIAE